MFYLARLLESLAVPWTAFHQAVRRQRRKARPAGPGKREIHFPGWWVLCSAILLMFGDRSLATEASSRDFFLRSWKTDQGLPGNAVTSIVQTQDGYVWLATYAGLARFDGVRFTVFSSANTPALQSDRLTSLFADRHGDLWIGHERGDLTRYHEGRFESFSFHQPGARRKISAIGEDEAGEIWMLNEEGTLIRARDGASCALFNDNGEAGMAQDENGRIWVASGGKLAELNRQHLLLETNDLAGSYVQGICSSARGGLWVAGDGRVRRWQSGRWVQDAGTNPCVTLITAMLETRSGNIAMGAVESGLYILSPSAGLLHFGRAEDFPQDWIRCLCEDREGTLWVGAGNGGLVALRAGHVKMFAPPDHWQGRVPLSAAVARDGSVWVTTEGAGVYQFLDGAWSHFGESTGLSNQFDWCVSEDAHRRLWVGSWGSGMYQKIDGSFEMPPGLENVKVPMAAILHAHDGVTWIGTVNGLIRYQDGAIQWYGEREGIKVPDVRTIAETPDGVLWFGTLGGGLGRLQNGAAQQYGKRDGLASDYVQCLHACADGTLWIGTYGGGLTRLRNGRFAKINSLSGLPDNFICGIEEDSHENLWIGTHAGIVRVAKKSLDDVAEGRSSQIECQTFGKGEGMSSIECSGGLQPSVCKTADGSIWFPTSAGLAVVNPNATPPPHRPVPSIIEEVQAAGRNLDLTRTNAGPLAIPPGWQRLAFRYTGLSFIAPDKIQFQYRLDGWEKTWEDAGTKRVVEYSYLPPGPYRFHVRASNNDGIWDDNDATFNFTVLPHFWQTWWFYAGTTLLATGVVASVVWQVSRRRMRRRLEAAEYQQAVERERTRIAKDIHDHLGANLTRISLLSQSAHGELQNPAQAAGQLERIYETSRELTRSMDEIVWAVNPQHDTLDSLASYLGNFAQEYLMPLGIRCRLEVPLHLPHLPITAETRHNVFLAFKEALHNVVKHAGASEVSIFLNLDGGGFKLAVRDNGKGFDPAAVPGRPGRGNGLKNMRQRLEKLGGRCEIRSAPGSGSEVSFIVLTSPPRGGST
ncbi:MAG TPA: two-component regulator propeller domain-containing protein [Candidatus Acidoferrales bacterium]|nr:two-component regulator propeller domain-containing protein [Candidatus Acidoferrales bacterium]